MTQILSFTSKYKALSRCLMNKIGVLNPIETRLVGKKPTKILDNYIALWDTGATNSVISKKIIQECNLKPTGAIITNGVNSSSRANTYVIDVYLPNRVCIPGLTVSEGKFPVSGDKFDILIGMDVIIRGDFAISNYNKKTTFSFRIPSLAEADLSKQPVKDKQTPVKKIENTPRNAKCPCGSQRKYKNCHGK